MQGGASTASLGQSEVPRVVSLSQQWRTGAHPASFAIPASFVDSTCTGPRRTGAHPTQHGAFRVEFAVYVVTRVVSAVGSRTVSYG